MRLLLIDDHPAFLDALESMLVQVPDLEVVGRAEGGRQGLRAAAELEPDLVLVDFSMPELDGIGVIRGLKAWPSPPKIVMLSLHGGPEYREMALEAGADAFLCKTDLHTQLVPLLERLDREGSGAR